MSEPVTALAAEQQTNTVPAADATAASTQGTAPADNGQQQAPAAAPTTVTETAPGAEATAKPDENTAPVPKAPEQYAEFTLQDGVESNSEILDQFKQVAKELDLTQEQAQKLIDLDSKRAAAQAEAFKKTSDGWFAQTQSDKEIGGDKLSANAAIAAQAIDKLGTPELKTLLQQTGLVYHPEIIRAFCRAGKAISEDTIVTGGSGNTSKAQRDSASALYPAQNN